MNAETPTAAVTGAAGYLGSRICDSLVANGWQVIKLGRHSSGAHNSGLTYNLERPISPAVRQALISVDVLIHAAYDLSLANADDIWRVNVEGTRRLLEAAGSANIGRVIVLSSMSAFEGTSQLYGRSKLEIEAMTMERGGCAVRPGLVYGKSPGGMAGVLRRLTNMPIVPVMAGGSGVYTVFEDDLMTTIVRLARAVDLPAITISVAHPNKVTLAELLKEFAADDGRACRIVRVPWRLAYWGLRISESLGLHFPFRADSVLGLIYTAQTLSGAEQLSRLGVTLRPFPMNAKSHRLAGEL